MGIESMCPEEFYFWSVKTGKQKDRYMVHTTPGNIFLSLAAAHSAFGFPPSRQSSNSNKGWRTGLEKETCEESTKVIVRTPQP
jgi:hypothetical protein